MEHNAVPLGFRLKKKDMNIKVDTTKKDKNDTNVSALFRQQFVSCWAFCHCRINIIYVHCQKILNSYALAMKQDRKACQRLTFLPISKACTIIFIFPILSIYKSDKFHVFLKDLNTKY